MNFSRFTTAVCVHVCMCACICVCVRACVYVCVYVCRHLMIIVMAQDLLLLCVCMMWMFVCPLWMRICVRARMCMLIGSKRRCMYVCMNACTFARMRICMLVCTVFACLSRTVSTHNICRHY
jgi:hypothetical protein